MRTLLMTFVAAAAFAGSVAPAAARDYPYCLQGRQTGYPGDCGFDTYAQCMATASGRDAYCGVNPRFAFARQNAQGWGQDRGVPRGYPRQRHHDRW